MSGINAPAVIEMSDVTVASMRDASFTVLEEVNWLVSSGEFWVVGGQQYSGKSDLLMLVAGLMNPAGGVCRVFGRETEDFGEAHLAERLRVGFVFQGGRLFNRLTIAENIALPLRYRQNLDPAEAAPVVEDLVELLELTPFTDVTPMNVAASWRYRAALGRALVLQPELLLLDVPLSGLGARHRQWLLRFLDQLWRGHEICGGRPLTVAVATDDLRPWQSAPRKYAILHDQKFVSLGSWEELERTNHVAVKDLLAETIEDSP